MVKRENSAGDCIRTGLGRFLACFFTRLEQGLAAGSAWPRWPKPWNYNRGLDKIVWNRFMPIYAYKCDACGHAKDVLQKMSDDPLTDCPVCGAPQFNKQLTAPGFQLKGTGWYATDFKGGGAAAAPAVAAGAATDAVASPAPSADTGSAAAPAASSASCAAACACH
jgi:putative FmdB family regulatory protein